jgi:HEAT repeat protein
MLRSSLALILGLLLFQIAQADEAPFKGKTRSEWLKIAKDDASSRNRAEAVAALSLMEPRDRLMIETVALALLNDKAARVRSTAAEGVVAIIRTSSRDEPVLFEALGKSLAAEMSEEIRLKIVELAKEMKQEQLRKLSPALAEALKSDKASAVRVAVAAALAKAGEQAKTVITAMADTLKDPDASVRAAVAEALGRIGDEAKIAVPAIKAVLKDADPGVRLAAAFALGRIGPESATAVPELSIAMASDTDVAVRKECARAFALLGLNAKSAVPALVKALREDKSEEVRQQAALTLGKMQGETREVAATMLEAVKKDPNKAVRIYAIHAMADSLGDGVRAYVKDFGDRLIVEPEGDVRLALVQELGALGPAAKDALPALNRAVADVQLSVRDEAKKAVKKVMGQ